MTHLSDVTDKDGQWQW